MRLIDADALREHLFGKNRINKYGDIMTDITELNVLFDVCKVDPVRHGRWRDYYPSDDSVVICTACDYVTNVKTNFCPNCGARMDEVEDDKKGN